MQDSVDDIFQAIGRDQPRVDPAHLPLDFPAELLSRFPTLRLAEKLAALSLLMKSQVEGRGTTLLKLSMDPDPRIAVPAAEALANSTHDLPEASAIALRIPVQLRPMVRSSLYRALGKTDDRSMLSFVRARSIDEESDEARASAKAAAVRLGGQAEREELIALVENARASTAEGMYFVLLYVGDRWLVRAALGWFDRDVIAANVGGHSGPIYVRMPDLATLLAHRLGVVEKPREDLRPLWPCPKELILPAKAAVSALSVEKMRIGELKVQPTPPKPAGAAHPLLVALGDLAIARHQGPTGTIVLTDDEQDDSPKRAGPTGTFVLAPEEDDADEAPPNATIGVDAEAFPAAPSPKGSAATSPPTITLAEYAEVFVHSMFGAGRRVYAKFGLEDAVVRKRVLEGWAARLKDNPTEAAEFDTLYADALSRLELG